MKLQSYNKINGILKGNFGTQMLIQSYVYITSHQEHHVTMAVKLAFYTKKKPRN